MAIREFGTHSMPDFKGLHSLYHVHCDTHESETSLFLSITPYRWKDASGNLALADDLRDVYKSCFETDTNPNTGQPCGDERICYECFCKVSCFFHTARQSCAAPKCVIEHPVDLSSQLSFLAMTQ